MAAKTPVSQGTAGFVDPNRGMIVQTPNDFTDVTVLGGREGFRWTLWYFDDIDTVDEWVSGIPGIVACFFFCDQSSGSVRAGVADVATGTISLLGSTTDRTGYLLVASRG